MNWINDFWNVMWPVFAGAGSLMLAFAIMFAFIVMPVVLLRVAWGSLVLGPALLRVRDEKVQVVEVDRENLIDQHDAAMALLKTRGAPPELFHDDVVQAADEADTSEEAEGDAQDSGFR